MSNATSALRDCRILVAEDEYMIAQEIAGLLADAGAETLGPFPRVAAAAPGATHEIFSIDSAGIRADDLVL